MVSPYLNRPIRSLDRVLQARLEAAGPAPGPKAPERPETPEVPESPKTPEAVEKAIPAPRRAA